MNVTMETVLFILALGGGVFAVYRYFNAPDNKAASDILLLTQRLATVETTVSLMATNHLPHIDAKVQLINDNVAATKVLVAERFARLETLIEERIPKKNT